MAGKDNLRPLTTEKAREIGKKGGIASVKVRKEKAMLRKAAETILSGKVTAPEFDEIFNLLGIKDKDKTYALLATAGIVQASINGNPAAYEKLMQLLGEKTDNLKIDGSVPVVIVDDVKE